MISARGQCCKCVCQINFVVGDRMARTLLSQIVATVSDDSKCESGARIKSIRSSWQGADLGGVSNGNGECSAFVPDQPLD